MPHTRSFTIVESASAAIRLNRAADFLRRLPPHQPVTIVAATRGAADDLARRVARERGATMGAARFSLTQLAARVAATHLAGQGIAPTTALGAEAIASRVAFDARRGGTLDYFGDVAATPGFPRALARTFSDLRLAGMPPSMLTQCGRAGHDLAALASQAQLEMSRAEIADRARLLDAAAKAVAAEPFVRAPLLLLDVPIDTGADAAFVLALADAATAILATVPSHDAPARKALERAGGHLEVVEEERRSDLGHLRACLFSETAPEPRNLDGSLRFFSAPGEARECVEIARRILTEARGGVPFDEMAVFVRSPEHYQGLLEHAFERAQVRAWFDRGTRRPHPAGRAFLALLACAAEGLSASRFAEYLSLGQLPDAGDGQPAWIASDDEVFGAAAAGAPGEEEQEPEPRDDHEKRPVLAGSLRAPRHWERMLVEAAVVGGDPARWDRRLTGLDAELCTRRDEIARDDSSSPRIAAIEDERARLEHLRTFALPIVREMAAWPQTALWGDWLDRLDNLAPRVLRWGAYVRRVLADLRPMATVGPVSIDEVRLVLTERLRNVDSEPPSRRYGRVFVGSPDQARGRSFKVVFVPGLAERMFPRKAAQDPLLLDEHREQLTDPAEAGHDRFPLVTQAERARRERLMLHLVAGAAGERLYVSYPRLDVAEGRARVPSFYALDVVRGATGSIPDLQRFTSDAAQEGDPTLAWPAPNDPARAIDGQEHDLAVLRTLIDADEPAEVRGRAHYILRLNDSLRRSVIERWGRSEARWSHLDGLTRVTDATREALQGQRLGARAYSVSALQKFAACPYQFFLSAVYRLEPAERPEPLQRLDPLTRGSLVHRIQADTYRELERRSELPVTDANFRVASDVLEAEIEKAASDYEDRLAPAIPRVWQEEIASIARDLRGWLRRTAEDRGVWVPRYFELSFGLPLTSERDPRSRRDEVQIDGRFRMRGAVDLVEEHRTDGTLRITDHKTGKDRTAEGLVIGGGATLQPVLYAAAVEQVAGRTIAESRLFFCTSAGGYKVRPIPLTAESRRAGVEALEIVDRAIELGSLAPAPRKGACAWCDFRPVCGPHEELRIARKAPDRLRDLEALRSRP